LIIIQAINRILPDWKGAVWNNEYNGIRPDVSEIRVTPSLVELQAAWDSIVAEQTAVQQATQAKITAKLADIEANLPTWKTVAYEYDALIADAQTARDTADIKALATVVIKALRRSKKAERTLYWLAKNSAT
jgi:membrane-bound lytic murein transglycosylase